MGNLTNSATTDRHKGLLHP